MGGNPQKSKWYSTPAEKRRRRPLNLTPSMEARERLERLAEVHGVSKTVVVDALVLSDEEDAIVAKAVHRDE